jgi:outer membrane immunogenic protein
MERLYFSSAIALALALSAGTALAADLPSRKGPPPAFALPPPLWTGFYAGLNAGYGWGTDSNVNVATTQTYDFFGARFDRGALLSAASASGTTAVKDNGFIGGGQLGYNYQWANSFVIGVEADIQGADIGGENSFAGANGWNASNQNFLLYRKAYGYCHPVAVGVLNRQLNRSATTFTDITKRTDWLGTVRGRLGWLATPTMLVFGTAGLAYGGVEARVQQYQTINNTRSTQLNPPAGPAVAFSLPTSAFGLSHYSDTRVGWTAGGGFEWMFMPNWSVKAEGVYYDLGSAAVANAPLVSVGPTLATTRAAASLFGTINQGATQVRYDGVIARAGLNYHFNWSPVPVVARY